jgi:hypothetical protein
MAQLTIKVCTVVIPLAMSKQALFTDIVNSTARFEANTIIHPLFSLVRWPKQSPEGRDGIVSWLGAFIIIRVARVAIVLVVYLPFHWFYLNLNMINII